MARTLLTVMAAAAALCLACADPTAVAPSEASPTPAGTQAFNLDNLTGKWWAYLREGVDGPYNGLELDIIKKTTDEIALYKQSWLLRHNSTNETNRASSPDLINWQNILFFGEFKFGKLNATYPFLIEVLPDSLHMRNIYLDGRIELLRVKYRNGKFSFREAGSIGNEFNFYRTLPDLSTYATCENFDIFDASDFYDADSLVGTWDTNRQIRGLSLSLRVSRKTAEEVSAYRNDLRNTTVEEADIDWTKVRLEAELFGKDDKRDDEFKAVGLVEFLDKPGSIRIIPLKETWDNLGTREVDNWFTSQNFLIKKDDEFLAIRNCDNPWQKAYASKRP